MGGNGWHEMIFEHHVRVNHELAVKQKKKKKAICDDLFGRDAMLLKERGFRLSWFVIFKMALLFTDDWHLHT